MPRGWGDRLRRALAGLLVLSVILMSAAQVNVLVTPAIDMPASAALSSADSHHDADVTDHHTDSPCKGHKRTHSITCCLVGGCPLLTAQLPEAPILLSAIMFVPMSYMPLVSARHEQAGYAPDPPPPRSFV